MKAHQKKQVLPYSYNNYFCSLCMKFKCLLHYDQKLSFYPNSSEYQNNPFYNRLRISGEALAQKTNTREDDWTSQFRCRDQALCYHGQRAKSMAIADSSQKQQELWDSHRDIRAMVEFF